MFSLGKSRTLVLVIACLAYAGGVEAADPQGCYTLDSGKFSVSIKVPGMLTLSASVPAMQILGITNHFVDNAFTMTIPLLSSLSQELPSEFVGEWSAGTKPNSFKVNMTELADMASQLQALGINAKVTQNFTGKVVDAEGDKISGSFNIALSASLGGKAASAKLSGTFAGNRASDEECLFDNQEDFSLLSVSGGEQAVKPAAGWSHFLVNALRHSTKP